jgi:sn-glycerol 3-phosphate transport system substrate-binding protein
MKRLGFLAVAVVLVLAGCGGGDDNDSGAPPGPDASQLPDCPLSALDRATKPVEIEYWHSFSRAPKDAIEALTEKFNESQSDVRVTLSEAASYVDNFTRYKAALGTDRVPDLFLGEDTVLQQMIDSRSVLPVAACLKADNATTDDLVARDVAYYSVQGVLQPMPFNNSNPVLYYDRALFEKAGLDPDKPPVTLDDLRTTSEKLVQSGASQFGIALKTDSWLIEQWLAKAGHTIVNNGNGRQQRATEVTFNDATGLELFTWFSDMAKDKLLLTTGTADIDHYLAVANSRAAMTIDTSAALGTMTQLFASGQYQHVKLGVAPMPGSDSPDGGVLVGGGANYIVNKGEPAEQAAAYRFAKWLVSPEVQAEWAAATGYTPISKSSPTLSPLEERYAEQPYYKVALDQLLTGPENEATAGAVIGAYGKKGEGMRGAIIDALGKLADGSAAPQEALTEAANTSNERIQEYNDRNT